MKRGACIFRTAVLLRARVFPLLLAAALPAGVARPALASVKFETNPGALPKTRIDTSKEIFNEQQPVFLEAEQVDYDQQAQQVQATGQVEVTQGDTIILADKLLYDQKTDTVRAIGNVSMLEANGNVFFADELELKNNLRAGVIRRFKARLSDNSTFAASRARRIDGHQIELSKAVYSPCKVYCRRPGDDSYPLWEVRSDHVLIDDNEQKVTYDDAYFEVYGVPIFYTPYLSHPTPNAENQSGFLVPEYQHNDNLGSVYKVPYYYSIAPDKDLTITPISTSNEGLVMAGEYRQQFDSGGMTLDGSVTRPKDRDALGNPVSGKQIRGHLNAVGEFDIAENYDWGFDVHRTTDDTYLRRYDFSNETQLTSRVYGEGFRFVDGSDRTYGVVQGLSFQGLTRPDDTDIIPFVLPLAEFNYESDPLSYHNSRVYLNANTMVLYRRTGAQSRRLSATAGWSLPYITQDGQVIEFSTQLRNDLYYVEQVALSGGELYDGVTGRVVPQASLTWRYPFINSWDGGSFILEPIANFTVSPGGGNPEKIPNEDSQVPEFTDINLFSENRFAGYDRVENGPRASYGLRGQAQFGSKYIDWLVGQHYRIDNDRSFPFSNDLGSHSSDYVGKIGVDYKPIYVAYRTRLDRETLAPKRNEVDATLNSEYVTMSGSYLSLRNDPVLDTKEEIVGTLGLNATENWTLFINGRRDLKLNQITSTALGLTFKNECTNITGLVGKEYTRDRDVKPDTTFLFRIALKNLE